MEQIDNLNAAHLSVTNANVRRSELYSVSASLQRSTETVTKLEFDCQQLRAEFLQAKREGDFVREVLQRELMCSDFAYQRLEDDMHTANATLGEALQTANAEIRALERAARQREDRSQEEVSKAVNKAVAEVIARSRSEFDDLLRASTKRLRDDLGDANRRFWDERARSTDLEHTNASSCSETRIPPNESSKNTWRSYPNC